MQKKAFVGVMLTAIISITLLMAGCFGQGGTGSDESKEESYQGEIQGLTAKLSDIDATHVLVTTAKERVYLRSVLFDLSDYVEKNVRVFGVYSEEDISDKPVHMLTVTQIDLLDGDEEVSFLSYSSSRIGLSFNYPDSFFEIKDTDTGLSLVHDGSSIDKVSLKVFKITSEFDDELYIEQNFKNDDFENLNEFGYANLKGVTNFNDTTKNKLVYIFKFDSFFYEVSSFSSDESTLEYIDKILSSVKYDGSPTLNFSDIAVDEDVEIDSLPKIVKEQSVGTSKFKSVIEQFGLKAKEVLPTYKNAVNFSFTDNGYFYLVYINDTDLKRRALIKYDTANFTVTAQFEPGTKEDWKLVSGLNAAYDRPQTFVPIALTGSTKDVEIKQGYRYFESLPLKFSSQYPQNWYYTRQEDTYLFSDKPLDESAPLMKIYVTKSTNLPAFSEVSGKTTYNVKLNGFTVSVSGDSTYANYLKVMAESVQEIID